MQTLTMVRTVLKNLFSKPATERYPFVAKKFVDGTRGKLDIEIDKCIFCGICQRKCPTAALTVAKESKMWTVDRMRCISCNACVDVCPKKCLKLNVQYTACSATRHSDAFSSEKPRA